MKIRIAILAVCVGMVALAQADNARANYANASDLIGSELVFPKLQGRSSQEVALVKGGMLLAGKKATTPPVVDEWPCAQDCRGTTRAGQKSPTSGSSLPAPVPVNPKQVK